MTDDTESKSYWLKKIIDQPEYVLDCLRRACKRCGYWDGLGWVERLVECIIKEIREGVAAPTPRTDDTLYRPRCDMPLDVVVGKPDEDFDNGETYCVSVDCPFCSYERTAIERTLCECWAIIEADMDRERRL